MAEQSPLDNPRVAVIMGSQSDWEVMRHSVEALENLGIPCEAKVISAHRTPARLESYVSGARERGLKVFIAGAGMAAALPGAIAALTPLPVFGVPMPGKAFGGMDSLLTMVQMPGGIPVGALAVGKAGAINAALLSASVLALSDDAIASALDDFRAKQTASVPENPEG
jgi:5-(carboxyamino)imidazole ribonucleotide mutase